MSIESSKAKSSKNRRSKQKGLRRSLSLRYPRKRKKRKRLNRRSWSFSTEGSEPPSPGSIYDYARLQRKKISPLKVSPRSSPRSPDKPMSRTMSMIPKMKDHFQIRKFSCTGERRKTLSRIFEEEDDQDDETTIVSETITTVESEHNQPNGEIVDMIKTFRYPIYQQNEVEESFSQKMIYGKSLFNLKFFLLSYFFLHILFYIIADYVYYTERSDFWDQPDRVGICFFVMIIIFSSLMIIILLPFFPSSRVAVVEIVLVIGMIMISSLNSFLMIIVPGQPRVTIFVLQLLYCSLFLNTRFHIHLIISSFNLINLVVEIVDETGSLDLCCLVFIFYCAMLFRMWRKEKIQRCKYLILLETKKMDEKCQKTHRKQDELLCNIMPKQFVKRCKSKVKNNEKQLVMEHYDKAAVISLDIANFTPFSLTLHPKYLVHFLNEVYLKFDESTIEHGLERIKTIGDEYICVEWKTGTAFKSISFGIDVTAWFEKFVEEKNLTTVGLSLRGGLGWGNLIGYVYGKENQSLFFDVLGFAMEECQRNQSVSKENKICISDRHIVHQNKRYFVFECDVDNESPSSRSMKWFPINHKKRKEESFNELISLGNVLSNSSEHTSPVSPLSPPRGLFVQQSEINEHIAEQILFLNEGFHDNPSAMEKFSRFCESSIQSVLNLITKTTIKEYEISSVLYETNPGDHRLYVIISIFVDIITFGLMVTMSLLSTRKDGMISFEGIVNEFIRLLLPLLLMSLKFMARVSQFNATEIDKFKVLEFVSFILHAISMSFLSVLTEFVSDSTSKKIFSPISMLSASFLTTEIPVFPKMLILLLYSIVFVICRSLSLPDSILASIVLIICVFMFIPLMVIIEHVSSTSFLLKYDSQCEELEKKTDQYKNEKDNNDNLLYSSMPSKIIKALMNEKKDTVVNNFFYVKSGSICFVYLNLGKPFDGSEIHELLKDPSGSTILVEFLCNWFTCLDELAIKNRCHKVKSTQFTYICVSGLVKRDRNHYCHIESIINFAKETVLAFHDIKMKYLLEFEKSSKESILKISDSFMNIEVGVGIHSGGFSSGIVGNRKYLWDVFGSSVNICCRLSQTSQPSHIQFVKKSFFQYLGPNACVLQHPNTMLKGKGIMKTFSLVVNGSGNDIQNISMNNNSPPPTPTHLEEYTLGDNYSESNSHHFSQRSHRVSICSISSPIKSDFSMSSEDKLTYTDDDELKAIRIKPKKSGVSKAISMERRRSIIRNASPNTSTFDLREVKKKKLQKAQHPFTRGMLRKSALKSKRKNLSYADLRDYQMQLKRARKRKRKRDKRRRKRRKEKKRSVEDDGIKEILQFDLGERLRKTKMEKKERRKKRIRKLMVNMSSSNPLSLPLTYLRKTLSAGNIPSSAEEGAESEEEEEEHVTKNRREFGIMKDIRKRVERKEFLNRNKMKQIRYLTDLVDIKNRRRSKIDGRQRSSESSDGGNSSDGKIDIIDDPQPKKKSFRRKKVNIIQTTRII